MFAAHRWFALATSLRDLVSLRGARLASVFFSQHFVKHLLVEREIGHQTLQPPVLIFELLQLPDLARRHLTKFLPPPVVRLLGDPELAADFGDRRSVLDLLLGQSDLLIRKSTPSHGLIFPF
jgi:hypothetical protein